uniref:Uncharacterized protein n=1 Tax=Solanum tuberosum TaxID=4113 RepID=M1DI97_SOLTU
MAKIMTQLDILSKNVMGAGTRSVNAVGFGCVNPDGAMFEALCIEEVNFLAKQGGGYCANYPTQGGNQRWNRDEVQIDKLNVQSATCQRAWRARPRPPLDSSKFEIGVCKTRQAQEKIGVSPKGTASQNYSVTRRLLLSIADLNFSFRAWHPGTFGIWIEGQSMDTIEHKEARQLKERRKEGLRIA